MEIKRAGQTNTTFVVYSKHYELVESKKKSPCKSFHLLHNKHVKMMRFNHLNEAVDL